MNITIANRRFSPGLFTSIVTLVFLALFIRLGVWQLNRAEYKASLYESFNSRQLMPPLTLESPPDKDEVDALIWQPVVATGQFKNEMQVLLDNRVIKGQVGYFVYTPFQLANEGALIMVNRGWIAAEAERSSIPPLQQTNIPVTLFGNLKAQPRTGMLLAETPPELVAPGVYRVQEVNVDKLTSFLDVSISPLILRLNAESDYGYIREWSLPGSDEQKHLGYAYQWFAFAVTLLLIYIVMNFKKDTKNEK